MSMSSRLDRVIADLDTEIADCQGLLNKLLASRKAALAARDASSRKASAPSSTRTEANGTGAPYPVSETIEETLCRIMANGQPWRVDDVHKAVLADGKQVDRPSVNSALSRGAKVGGSEVFERVAHGVYRVQVGSPPTKEEESNAAPQ